MSNVIKLEHNEILDLLAEYTKEVRAGRITHLMVIGQTESEDSVAWTYGEAGEINPNPEHIATYIGQLDMLQHYAREAYIEALE